jgi:ataxia telangiectasia mutated family protein
VIGLKTKIVAFAHAHRVSNSSLFKLLNTPERVPFRLTRNMVDGMGPSGTEGTFSHAAEETSRVLRGNASALLTILSAIVSDPLYKWSVSPVKARRRQAQEDEEEAEQPYGVDDNHFSSTSAGASLSSKEEHNKAAQQAVARIDEKLKGFEDGTSGEQQSVEGQVQLLITTARDQDSLCQMFPGWAPWI